MAHIYNVYLVKLKISPIFHSRKLIKQHAERWLAIIYNTHFDWLFEMVPNFTIPDKTFYDRKLAE